MNYYAAGLIVSLVVYLAVGAYAGRKVKHLEDFFVAGRQAPTPLIVGTLVASLMSTNAFMGETGTAYGGFALVTVQMTAINIVGYVLGGLYFGRFLRRSRSLTVAEYFGNRFASRRVQAVAGITLVIGCTTYLFIICQGVSAIIGHVSDLSFGTALLLTWLSVCSFTLYSGTRGVILTDTIKKPEAGLRPSKGWHCMKPSRASFPGMVQPVPVPHGKHHWIHLFIRSFLVPPGVWWWQSVHGRPAVI